MPTTLIFGNVSVVETYKEDEGVNLVKIKARKDLGKRVTTMFLSETSGRMVDGEWVETEDRSMNFSMVLRFWPQHSDKDPAWVEGDDKLLVALVADHFGIPDKRPKDWKEG